MMGGEETHKIIDETRRSVIDAILALGSMAGDKEYNCMSLVIRGRYIGNCKAHG